MLETSTPTLLLTSIAESPVRSVDGTFEDTCHSPSQTTILSDAIQTILEEHQRVVGFYRMAPPRPILVPHKITLEHIFSDQSHLLVDQRSIRLPPRQGYTFSTHLNSSQSMSFLNFSQNQRTLHETESVQLLSSLVVRAIQIHRNHDRLLPGASAASITDVLSISPMLPPRLTSKPYPHVQMKASRDGTHCSYRRPCSYHLASRRCRYSQGTRSAGRILTSAQNPCRADSPAPANLICDTRLDSTPT